MRLCRPAPAPASRSPISSGGAVRPTDGHRHRHQSAPGSARREGSPVPHRPPRRPLPFRRSQGASNYLCLQRLDELEADDRLDLDLDDTERDSGSIDGDTLDELRAFATTSATGDRSELETIDDRTWRLVSVGRDECPGANRCPGRRLSREKARHRAAEADILVVNLHLYALAITVDAVLPEHDLVMIDEAHQLQDIVAEAAGRQISPARVQAAARNTASVLVDMEPSQRAEESATSLHVALEPLIGERLLDGPDAEVGKALDDVRAATERLLDGLRAVPESAPADTRTKALRARTSRHRPDRRHRCRALADRQRGHVGRRSGVQSGAAVDPDRRRLVAVREPLGEAGGRTHVGNPAAKGDESARPARRHGDPRRR